MTVSRELARYKLDLVGVEVRWEGGGTKPAGEYTFYPRLCSQYSDSLWIG
jgi:hypothetical protein